MNNLLFYGALGTTLAAGFVAGAQVQLSLDKKTAKKNSDKVGELLAIYMDMMKYKEAAMFDETITPEEYAERLWNDKEFMEIVYRS